MPVLRLFAAAREAAGTATEQVPGATVDEVLSAARLRHGQEFGRVLETSRVWCNGEPATGDQPVGEVDEVAVLPPVSGGAEPPSEERANRPRTGPGRRRSGATRGGQAPRAGRHFPAGSARAAHRTPPRPAAAPETVARTAPLAGASNLQAPEPPVDEGPKDPTDRLTRLRSVPVPLTGQVAIRGRTRLVSGVRARRTAFGRRYAVVYDTSGHKVSLGVAWFIAAMGALALGWAPLALLFGVAAGWAAMEVAGRAWQAGQGADRWVAGLGAGAIGAAGAAGSGLLGGAILVVILAALVVAVVGTEAREDVVPVAGATVLAAVPFGLAAACVLLTRDLGIGAAVVLILFVSVYEAGDFLIGSGAQNSLEGPLVGILTVALTGALVAVLQVPPFDGVPAFAFAAMAAVACPVGQLACSALLPAPDARAPSARRLDSLLVLAPVWAFTSGLFIAGLG